LKAEILRRQKIFQKIVFFCLFEPENLKYIKIRKTKVVRNIKTHFLRSKFEKNKIIEKLLTGPNQVLSKHPDDIVFYNLTFCGANMSCEHEKRKKGAKVFEKTVFCLKKP
jgi:hypothetical protein